MGKINNSSLLDVDPKSILRIICGLKTEIGVFSASCLLYEHIYKMKKQKGANSLGDLLDDCFPMYSELAGHTLGPNQINQTIEGNVNTLAHELRDYYFIVVVGIESLILDRLTTELKELQFFLIPHSERVNNERILDNLPRNVSLIGVEDVMGHGGARSVLLSYVFCQSYENSFVYPVALRSIGPDVRSSYNKIIGLNILSGYKRFLGDMAHLDATGQFFTNQFRIV